MSYVVFALKWRPGSFKELVGQDHIVTTLQSAIEKERLAHAYLFAGPRGVGKTSAARILAKSLNCKEGPTVTPCEKCPSCLEIAKGTSLDVIEIDGASNRGIDEIRQLRENVKFSPVQGKSKVYIIDEVHQITPDGFNALLKTLEEPPKFVKFIFATTHPHKVPLTILSRCHRLDFRRITVKEIIAQLKAIVTAEKIPVDSEVLFAIAKASDGSLRDAESILDQIVSFSKGTVSLKDVVSVLGIVEQEALFSLSEAVQSKDPLRALTVFNGIVDDGKDLGAFSLALIEHFRNLMVAKVSAGDSLLIDLPQEVCDKLAQQAAGFTLQELFTAFNTLVNTQEMAKRLDSPRIPFEVALVQLSQEKNVVVAPAKSAVAVAPSVPVPAAVPVLTPAPVVAPARTLAPAHTQGSAGHVPHKVAEQPVPHKPQVHTDVAVQAVPLEKVKECWLRVIESLGKVKMHLSTYLNEGEVMEVKGNIITVAFPKNHTLHKTALERRDNKEVVEKTASVCCGVPVKFNFILSAAHHDKHENPALKTALETFNGRVVKEEDSGDLYGIDRKTN